MKKQLIINTVPSFDPENQIHIFLWPLLKSTMSLEETEPFLEHISLSHTEQKQLNDSLISFMDNILIPHVQEVLNQKHQVNYDSAYWGILLKPWLSHLLNTAYYYFLSVTHVLKKHPHTHFWVDALECTRKWESKDTFDFIYRCYQDPMLHWAMLSLLIKYCFPSRITIQSTVSAHPEPADYADGIESIRDHRSRRFFLVRGVSTVQEWLLSAFLFFKQPSQRLKKIFHWIPNSPPLEVSEPFLDALLQLALITLPESFDKHFRTLDQRAQKIGYCPGKIRVIGPVTVLYEQLKFYLAHAHCHKEIIITTQHGGNYGWHLMHREPMLIDYQFDYFISWGWTLPEPEYARIHPMPSPYMRAFKNKYHPQTSKLILIGTDINPYTICFMPNPFGGNALIAYRKSKISFLNQLHTHVATQAFYRGYPLSPGRFPDERYVQENTPHIQTISGNLHPHLLTAKLVCLDHLGTTLCICLAANIPFICFWDPAHCDLNQDGQQWLDDLKTAGLYFDSPIAAAEQVNAIWDNIPKWWESKQPLIKKLQTWHANTTPWMWAWVKFLYKL
jgi:hypothetical protein